MLHYQGDQMAMQLGKAAQEYIWMYEKKGSNNCYVPFIDLAKGNKRRYVKFEKMEGIEGWVYVDLVDSSL